MVKLILIFLFATLSYSNTYETNCLSCHKSPIQLNMFMKRYTLKYSSEPKIKDAIFQYLRTPTQQQSVMPFGFIRRWGTKEKSILNDEELKKAIDIYYEKYNLKQFIK